MHLLFTGWYIGKNQPAWGKFVVPDKQKIRFPQGILWALCGHYCWLDTYTWVIYGKACSWEQSRDVQRDQRERGYSHLKLFHLNLKWQSSWLATANRMRQFQFNPTAKSVVELEASIIRPHTHQRLPEASKERERERYLSGRDRSLCAAPAVKDDHSPALAASALRKMLHVWVVTPACQTWLSNMEMRISDQFFKNHAFSSTENVGDEDVDSTTNDSFKHCFSSTRAFRKLCQRSHVCNQMKAPRNTLRSLLTWSLSF